MNEVDIRHDRRICFAAAAVSLVLMFLTPSLAGFTVDFASFWPLYVLVAVFAVFLPYTAWRDLRRLHHGLEASILGLIMTLPVLVFSYAAMRPGFALADGSLIAADRLIGFDWPALVHWVDQYPLLASALAYSYSSFSLQLLLLPILLSMLNFQRRAYQVALGYLLLCSAAIGVSTFFPSVGAYEGYGFDGRALSHVNAHFGYLFLDSFNAVRQDTSFRLSFDNAAGIITFPSIHAGVALLCVWATWPSPLLRSFFSALNVLMATSAITHGAHYLVDIFAGFAVAAGAIIVVQRLTRRADSTPAVTSGWTAAT